ncbi:FAD-binding domain-containing protein [Phellopilus nigrolimitatus]|nr:FAD-binding domain-containing protein [Phellopilus nigrolimitatus]
MSLLALFLIIGLINAESVHPMLQSASVWDAFNRTVEGRLIKGVPWALPCFPRYESEPNAVDGAICSSLQADYTLPEYRVSSFGAYMQPQWETCQESHQQCLLDSSNPADPAAFENSTCSQGSIPPYYVDVRNASDVQSAFAFAKRTGISLSIKNSGHDYKGRSSGRNTLGLWVHNLDSITSDARFVPEGCDANSSFSTITTGTGALWADVYKYAEEKNITVIGGYSQTIAAGGGWLMGGGHSDLSPVYGLGVDRVLQIKLVTPDGEVRVANACQDSGLFWALRGGGGSTFGVVLEVTYKVEKRVALQVAKLSFNGTSENLPQFYGTLVNSSLNWGNVGWGGHVSLTTMIYVNPLLSLSEAEASMRPMSDWILSQNGSVVIESLPSWYTFFQKYVLSAEAPVGIPLILTTRLIPKSLFETDEGRTVLTNVLIDMIPIALPYIPVVPPVLFKATEGATSITPAWRNALWHLAAHATWQFNTSVPDILDKYALVHNVTEILREIAPDSGAYFNEGDVYEPDHEKSYWGPNYPRLLQLKNKYDPFHLLDCWQCVGWKGAADARYSCYLPEPTSSG